MNLIIPDYKKSHNLSNFMGGSLFFSGLIHPVNMGFGQGVFLSLAFGYLCYYTLQEKKES